jgi:hypothetical protein
MTGSEQIDGLQAKMTDRNNRWKPPGTTQTRRSRCGRPAPRPTCPRYCWAKRTAMLPSPAAAATRLTELARTSPTANTPGRLLSSRYGPPGMTASVRRTLHELGVDDADIHDEAFTF